MNIKISMVLALSGIMTLCLAVTKPLANQAFAKISCESLTLKANPGSVAHTPPEGTVQDLTGNLICGEQNGVSFGMPGANIHLSSATGSWAKDVNTDSSGNFGLPCASVKCDGLVVSSSHSYIITAKYAGDPEHGAVTARITITTRRPPTPKRVRAFSLRIGNIFHVSIRIRAWKPEINKLAA